MSAKVYRAVRICASFYIGINKLKFKRNPLLSQTQDILRTEVRYKIDSHYNPKFVVKGKFKNTHFW